jgi:hypothetical protein
MLAEQLHRRLGSRRRCELAVSVLFALTLAVVLTPALAAEKGLSQSVPDNKGHSWRVNFEAVNGRLTDGNGVTTSKQFYEIVFSFDGRRFKHGIRIDLLSANGVPSDFVASLAHPCAVLTDGMRVCGPRLGTCVQYWKTDRCDFSNGVRSDLRQMWDRLLGKLR